MVVGLAVVGWVAGPAAAWAGNVGGLIRTAQPPTASGPFHDAPFLWTLKVDGKAQTLSTSSGELALPMKGWSCGYTVDPPTGPAPEVNQFGALDCRHRASGRVIDAMVLCHVSDVQATDCGSTTLSMGTAGELSTRVQLSCGHQSKACTRPPIQLGSAVGQPSVGDDGRPVDVAKVTEAPAVDRFKWRVEAIDPGISEQGYALTAPSGPIEHGLAGWTCEYATGGSTDPNYGYVEVGSITCSNGERAVFSTSLPCLKLPGEAHYCNMGSLRFTDGKDGMRALTLACKDAENAGCF